MPLVKVAQVLRPHGVRGELRVRPLAADSQALQVGSRVLVRWPDGAEGQRTVTSVRPAAGGLLVRLDATGDRDAAEELRGAELLVDGGALPELPGDVYYAFQLVGCRVVDSGDGRDCGRVQAVLDNSAHDLLQVRWGGREWLLPFVAAYVREVDLGAGVVRVVDVAG
ncbi:MAG: 16S rRNA processing protein RimM, partial [Deltaproteobacteria bacterium]|nr:16S rRNA processing protein RimM [Deltaproteobacteria bacterium]